MLYYTIYILDHINFIIIEKKIIFNVHSLQKNYQIQMRIRLKKILSVNYNDIYQ